MYGRGRDLRRPVGVGWCACDMTNIIHHVHAHLAGLGVVGWVLCRVVPTLSDLWGGVNGHGVDYIRRKNVAATVQSASNDRLQ